MTYRLLSSLLLVFAFLTATGQNSQPNKTTSSESEKCFTDQVMDSRMSDPDFAAGRESAERKTRSILDSQASHRGGGGEIYTIPVVFHVIHEGEPVGSGTNISDEQILSAVEALNRDFSATTADGGIAQSDIDVAAGNTNIEFCMASVDPVGNSTTGIVRVDGSSVSQYSSQGITEDNQMQVKNLSRWDNRYYLNVWVVAEIFDNGGDVADPDNFTGGTLGYAYLPADPVTLNSQLDGIVVTNLCLGNDPGGVNGYRLAYWTQLNRTLTHEVGHHLNLHHTFQDESCSEFNCSTQGDLVCDTPPTTLNNDCNSPACSGTQQVENYMDYTGEECYEMFSQGQKDRMRACLAGVRNELVSTTNCNNTYMYDVGLNIVNSGVSGCQESAIVPEVELSNYGAMTLTSVSFTYELNGGGESTFDWTGNLEPSTTTTVALPEIDPPSGSNTYSIELVANSLNGNQLDESDSNNSDEWTFSSASGSQVMLSILLDNYPAETSWELTNSNNAIVASGGPYWNLPESALVEETFCLPAGCYDFTIYDDAGDGLCCGYGIGSYTLENLDTDEVLANGASFGSLESTDFCITEGSSGGEDCEASSENCDEFITSVSLGGQEFASGCDNYSLTSDVIELTEGEEHTLTVETQDGSGDYIGYTDDQVAAWIDWNADGDFDDANELIFQETYDDNNVYPNSQTFTIPADASSDVITLRVRMSFFPDDGQIAPCGTTSWGEVEDYQIQVTELETILTILETPQNASISCEDDFSSEALGAVTASTTCTGGGEVDITFTDNIIEGNCDHAWTIVRNWTIQDGCGNTSTHQQLIEVSDDVPPEVECENSTIQITAVEGEAEVPDLMGDISGSDNCSSNLSFEQSPASGTSLLPGEHTITLTAYDACGNVTECEVTLDIITGIEEIFAGTIEVYPNPTNGLVEVVFSKTPLGNVSLEVYAVNGQLISREKLIEKARHQIDLNDEPSGLYFLHIKTEKGTVVKKLSRL